MSSDSKKEFTGFALDRAAACFAVHAEQRMKMFHFYVLLMLGFVAGFSSLFRDGLPAEQATSVVGFCVSLGFGIVTYAFKQLDRRTALLIKSAETALRRIEQDIAAEIGCDSIRLIEAADQRASLSYRQAFNIVFLLGGAFSLSGMLITGSHVIGLLCR